MDIASIALHFLCAAVAGFLIMSIFGVQALVALCSSISLARRRKHQVPAFDLALALRRIAWRTVIGFLGVAVISALMIWLTAAPGTFGYLFGMILSFLKNLNRITPNDRKNQRRFEKMFADCYPYEDELDGDDDFDWEKQRPGALLRGVFLMSAGIAMSFASPQFLSVGDAVPVVVIPDSSPHRLFRKDRAVELMGRKAVQSLHHCPVGELQGLGNRLALDHLRSHRAGGDGTAAAEGVELYIGNHLGLRVHLDIHPHDIPALGVAHLAHAVGVGQLPHVPGMLEVVHHFITI